MKFQNYDTIIFDLDDTLYLEIDYFKEAFQAISTHFEENSSVNAIEIAHFLTTTFIENGRQNLFNQCFNRYFSHENAQNTEGVVSEDFFVNTCLTILRTVKIKDKIALFPYVYTVLPQLLLEKKQIFVVTNGNVQQQKNKIQYLDWQNLDTQITFVFANEYAPKPSPKVFSDFLVPNFNLKNKRMLFIGDAETDAQFSQNIGADFLHVDFFK